MNKKDDDRRTSKRIASEKKERAFAEGQSAMAELAARDAFVRANTIKLREMRLAKEAAEREAEAAAPPKVAVKPKRKPKPA
jgi:hypothetical protein